MVSFILDTFLDTFLARYFVPLHWLLPIQFGCDETFIFSFWRSGLFWANGFNCKVVQLHEAFNLIYILKVVKGVLLTSPSVIHVKGESKHDFGFDLRGSNYPRDDREKAKIGRVLKLNFHIVRVLIDFRVLRILCSYSDFA